MGDEYNFDDIVSGVDIEPAMAELRFDIKDDWSKRNGGEESPGAEEMIDWVIDYLDAYWGQGLFELFAAVAGQEGWVLQLDDGERGPVEVALRAAGELIEDEGRRRLREREATARLLLGLDDEGESGGVGS